MNNFAVLNIAYSPAPTTLPLSIETNTPCHLTCYYTDKEPGSHRTSRNQRGLTRPWGVYYCFVAWQSLEQTEAGDTLIHTFEILDWSYCQTKWLAFRGTVAGELSPSVSPIFKYHHPGVLPARFEYYNVDDDTGHLIAADLWEAQTFTPQLSHAITSFKLKLYRVGFPRTITIGIRATFEGLPTGPDLIHGSIDGNTLTTDTDGEWREVELPGGPALLAPVMYAGVARAPTGFPLNYAVWRADGTFPDYIKGTYCTSPDSGETWHKDRRTDFMFEEWGIAI